MSHECIERCPEYLIENRDRLESKFGFALDELQGSSASEWTTLICGQHRLPSSVTYFIDMVQVHSIPSNGDDVCLPRTPVSLFNNVRWACTVVPEDNERTLGISS